ncbi:hypothetical protein KODAMA_02270 [Serratia phage vB_SmaM-Kodama]|nr:hypothetical protein KODAMA_02270 [Serratia phage vB_SmaM-Kodama]
MTTGGSVVNSFAGKLAIEGSFLADELELSVREQDHHFEEYRRHNADVNVLANRQREIMHLHGIAECLDRGVLAEEIAYYLDAPVSEIEEKIEKIKSFK